MATITTTAPKTTQSISTTTTQTEYIFDKSQSDITFVNSGSKRMVLLVKSTENYSIELLPGQNKTINNQRIFSFKVSSDGNSTLNIMCSPWEYEDDQKEVARDEVIAQLEKSATYLDSITTNFDMTIVGSKLEPGRVPDYGAGQIVNIELNGPTNVAYIDLAQNDIKFKGKLDSNLGLYWGKVVSITDINNKWIDWAQSTEIAGNAKSYITYDATSRYFVVDVGLLLNAYPAAKKIYIAYTSEFKPLVYRTSAIDEELILPSKIACVVGKEMNCYWENALLYGRMNGIQKIDTEYTLFNSERFRDRFIWTPTAENTTAMKVFLYKKSLKQYDAYKTVTFKAVSATAGSGTKTAIVIGDSKTAYGQIVRKLKSLFDADTTLDLTLLGTRYDNNNSGEIAYKHEGRAGWSIQDYCTLATKDEIVNPFYNSGFDFSNYMTVQSYASVDYVIVNLSTNDFGRSLPDVIKDLSTMIDSIHAYNNAVKVVVCLTEGVYRDKMEWDARNTWFIQMKKQMILTYDNREAEKIYLCPLYLNMDLYEDYDLTDVALSAEDAVKTRKYSADGIHQNSIGFNKNGDTLYYTMKYIESLG